MYIEFFLGNYFLARPVYRSVFSIVCVCVCVCFGADFESHYRLPMDAVDVDGYLQNPSSLHAVLHRTTRPGYSTASPLTRGVDGQAVRVNGANSFIEVDTTALKTDCFGDLNKCHMGE